MCLNVAVAREHRGGLLEIGAETPGLPRRTPPTRALTLPVKASPTHSSASTSPVSPQFCAPQSEFRSRQFGFARFSSGWVVRFGSVWLGLARFSSVSLGLQQKSPVSYGRLDLSRQSHPIQPDPTKIRIVQRSNTPRIPGSSDLSPSFAFFRFFSHFFENFCLKP